MFRLRIEGFTIGYVQTERIEKKDGRGNVFWEEIGFKQRGRLKRRE